MPKIKIHSLAIFALYSVQIWCGGGISIVKIYDSSEENARMYIGP